MSTKTNLEIKIDFSVSLSRDLFPGPRQGIIHSVYMDIAISELNRESKTMM